MEKAPAYEAGDCWFDPSHPYHEEVRTICGETSKRPAERGSNPLFFTSSRVVQMDNDAFIGDAGSNPAFGTAILSSGMR